MKRVGLAKGLILGTMLAAAQSAQALEPDVNLSGTFGLSLSYFDKSNDSGIAEVSDVDLENNASNFRLTAAAQDVGIRAFIAYERGAETEEFGIEQVREFFGGVSGKYGTLLYGRKATDYRLAGERLDPFYNTSMAGFNGSFASEGGGYGLSNLTNGFTSNTIAYRSPVFFGFSGNVAAYINDDPDTGNGEETDYAAGLGYANSDWLGLDVGVQYLSINGGVVALSPGDSDNLRVHGSIGQKLWAVGLSFEIVDVGAEQDPRKYAFVSGSYQLLEDLRLALSYGNVKDTPDGIGFDGNGATVGAFYDLTKNLTTYAALRYVALDNTTEDTNFTVASGVKFVFDVDL